jgi:hypothetical protein
MKLDLRYLTDLIEELLQVRRMRVVGLSKGKDKLVSLQLNRAGEAF